MLIKNIFVYVSINIIGILIDWSDNKAIYVKKFLSLGQQVTMNNFVK
jgi:hypothetical protein